MSRAAYACGSRSRAKCFLETRGQFTKGRCKGKLSLTGVCWCQPCLEAPSALTSIVLQQHPDGASQIVSGGSLAPDAQLFRSELWDSSGVHEHSTITHIAKCLPDMEQRQLRDNTQVNIYFLFHSDNKMLEDA